MKRLRSLRALPEVAPLESRTLLNGSLDATFDGDGRLLVDFSKLTTNAPSLDERAYSAAVQSDGKILVVGEDRQGLGVVEGLKVARLNPNGSFDASFGNGGLVAIPVSYQGPFHGVEVRIAADGKIVVLGKNRGKTTDDLMVVRLNPNGSYDASFDGDGVVLGEGMGQVTGAAVTPDGGIVIVLGRGTIVRLRANGSFDPAFGESGKTRLDFLNSTGSIEDVVIQPDGRILLAANDASRGPVVVRLLADGKPDPAFGESGRSVAGWSSGSSGSSPGGVSRAATLTLQGDGKILLAGSSGPAFAVARFQSNGALDTTFDGDGWATIPFDGQGTGAWAEAVAVDGQGRVILAGSVRPPITQPGFRGVDFAVVRLTSTGALDSSFGAGGRASVDFTADGALTPRNDQAVAALLQPSDGKILLVGTSEAGGGGARFALARLNVVKPVEDPGDRDDDPPGDENPWNGRRHGVDPRIQFRPGFTRRSGGIGTTPVVRVLPTPIAPVAWPPQVVWASLTRGRRVSATIGLDVAVNRRPVSAVGGYQLIAAGDDGLLGTDDDRTVRVASVRYNAAAKTVTIVGRNAPAGPIRLIVKARTLVSTAGAAAGEIVRDLA